jgi:stage II sporulation protein M
MLVGTLYAAWYPMPPGFWSPQSLTEEAIRSAPSIGFLPTFTVEAILSNNIRSLLLAGILAIFSFGSLAVVLLMAPIGIIGFFTYQIAHWGLDPLLFLATFVLPHGIFELPAAILATAAALRLGASVVARPPQMTVGEGWLAALTDFVKVFVFVTLPLLLIAAFVEVNLTLRVVLWAYGAH